MATRTAVASVAIGRRTILDFCGPANADTGKTTARAAVARSTTAIAATRAVAAIVGASTAIVLAIVACVAATAAVAVATATATVISALAAIVIAAALALLATIIARAAIPAVAATTTDALHASTPLTHGKRVRTRRVIVVLVIVYVNLHEIIARRHVVGHLPHECEIIALAIRDGSREPSACSRHELARILRIHVCSHVLVVHVGQLLHNEPNFHPWRSHRSTRRLQEILNVCTRHTQHRKRANDWHKRQLHLGELKECKKKKNGRRGSKNTKRHKR
ncbi:hypothetical protein BC940DRAFT_306441 [Gongronella butleri]|nr:hypothetical protein BC940DRAFT_306441 [Gongronella butleri]